MAKREIVFGERVPCRAKIDAQTRRVGNENLEGSQVVLLSSVFGRSHADV